MPLLDHFHPPLSSQRHWEGFHSAWANEIVRELNGGLLPQPYFAEPHISFGQQIEIDVASLRADESATVTGRMTYAPPAPTTSVVLDEEAFCEIEVQVFRDDGGPRLAAAIELISPSNKDRLAHRRAFAMKCGSLLHQSVGVLIIDVVTNRHANLHREICELLGVHHPTSDDNALYAASYQTIVNGKMQFNTWVEDFAIGDELPELPLWLDCDLALPIRLQGSYRQTCRTLLIGERPK